MSSNSYLLLPFAIYSLRSSSSLNISSSVFSFKGFAYMITLFCYSIKAVLKSKGITSSFSSLYSSSIYYSINFKFISGKLSFSVFNNYSLFSRKLSLKMLKSIYFNVCYIVHKNTFALIVWKYYGYDGLLILYINIIKIIINFKLLEGIIYFPSIDKVRFLEKSSLLISR